MCSAMNAPAFSSSSPPISPTMTTRSVSSSSSNRDSASMNELPTIGSPPMPTIVELPSPRSASSLPIWYVSVPDLDTSPTRPLANTWAGMMPTLATSGDSAPGQFGPSSVTPRGRM